MTAMRGRFAWLRGKFRRAPSAGVLHFLTSYDTVLASLDMVAEGDAKGLVLRGDGIAVASGTADRFAWELPGGEAAHDDVEGNITLSSRDVRAGDMIHIRVCPRVPPLTGMGRAMADAIGPYIGLAWRPLNGRRS
jgi:hypothetical protein